MVSHNRLRQLLALRGTPCATLTLPVAPSGPEPWQGSIRLKDQVNELEGRLDSKAPERAEMLQGLRDMLEDKDFWMHQRRGLMALAAFEPVQGKVQLAPDITSRQPELLVEAACVAMVHWADVHVVPTDQRPTESGVAAVLRR